jgi:hypothetical protein
MERGEAVRRPEVDEARLQKQELVNAVYGPDGGSLEDRQLRAFGEFGVDCAAIALIEGVEQLGSWAQHLAHAFIFTG